MKRIYYFIVFTLLLFGSSQQLKGQELLGKTTDEIRRFIAERTDDLKETGDTLSFVCEEQDDLGRLFDIRYRFVQREGKCISFQKQIPLHTFWIQRLKEKVEMLEGKGEGQELEVEGETVYPIYRFDKRCLKIEIDNENLTLFWSTMSNRIPIRYID